MNRYIEELAAETLAGGATVRTDTHSLERVTSGGYSVGGGAWCHTLEADSPNLASWLLALVSVLKMEGRSQRLGTWTDEGIVYAEVVDIIRDRAEAEATGRARGELAIFDLDNQEVIWL